MTIPTCSSFGLCKLSRILAGTHSFWGCRTVLFHWLREVKRLPFLRARNLKKRPKVSGFLALQFQHRRTASNLISSERFLLIPLGRFRRNQYLLRIVHSKWP